MANIAMRGLKYSHSTALRNLNSVQGGLPFVSRGDSGQAANSAEKTSNIFARKPKHGGLIEMFSTAVTAGANDPKNPGINPGPGPIHDDHPGGKGAEKPGKDTRSDPKNLHEEAEAKK